jgi:hypothetical protein
LLVLTDSGVEAFKPCLGAKNECFEAFYSPVAAKTPWKRVNFSAFHPNPRKRQNQLCLNGHITSSASLPIS